MGVTILAAALTQKPAALCAAWEALVGTMGALIVSWAKDDPDVFAARAREVAQAAAHLETLAAARRETD